jgi:D-alanyl-D-alanine carboxypeptidase
MYWHIPSIRFGRRVMRNTNSLIGRYPDADGMKTGFICASGFNVVATATRNGRKLIVVVFGSRSGMVRSEKAAQLFERGFSAGGLGWLMPSFGTVEGLQPVAAAPPNLRDEMCGRHRKRPAREEEDSEAVQALNANVDPSSAYAGTLQSLRGGAATGPLLGPLQASVPIPVWTGLRPGSQQATQVAERRGKKKSGTAVARTAPAAKPDAKPAPATAETKPEAKPATANASAGGFSLTPSIRLPSVGSFAPASAETKPVAAPASGDKNGAAKPKTAAKPDQKATAANPAAKPDQKAAAAKPAKPKTAAKPDAKSTKQ